MELLTVKETAQLLRVSPITVRRYIASGQLAAERVGRGIRVRRKAIETFVTPIESKTNTRESRELSRNPSIDSRHADENWVEIWSPSDPNGSVWVHIDQLDDYLDGRDIREDDPLWNIVGIGRSGKPTNTTEHKHEHVAEADLGVPADNLNDPDPDDLLGKPFTMNDPLWSVFGIGESDDPTDVAENKYEYLADAYLSDKG